MISKRSRFILVLLAGYALACYVLFWAGCVVLDRPMPVKWDERAQAISVLVA